MLSGPGRRGFRPDESPPSPPGGGPQLDLLASLLLFIVLLRKSTVDLAACELHTSAVTLYLLVFLSFMQHCIIMIHPSVAFT